MPIFVVIGLFTLAICVFVGLGILLINLSQEIGKIADMPTIIVFALIVVILIILEKIGAVIDAVVSRIKHGPITHPDDRDDED